MFLRFATVFVTSVLALAVVPDHAAAQTFESGKVLFEHGEHTLKTAKTKQDLEKARRNSRKL